MKMGVIGMLLNLLGASLLAAAWLYFDLSWWLVVPGVGLMLVGSSLVSGFLEQVKLAGRQQAPKGGKE
jgi:hypothetical protein